MSKIRGQFCWLRIPDYPLWAWLRLEPGLQGRELIVSQASRVLTCTPLLQEIGVNPGMALERAIALAAQAQPLVRPEPGEQGLFLWEETLSKVNHRTPRLEDKRLEGKFSILAELTPSEAEEMAGELSCCAGWAYDRNTAYLASLLPSVGESCSVARGAEKEFRDNLSCLHLLAGGVTMESIQRLIWLGFPTIGSLQRLTSEQLLSRFGRDDSRLFLTLAHGLSEVEDSLTRVPLFRPAEVLSVTHIFEPALRESIIVPEVFQLLLKSAVSLLGERQASWLGCRVEVGQGKERALRRFLKLPTALYKKLGPVFKACWESLFLAEDEEWERVTLELGGLKRPPTTQTTLFEERTPWRVFLPTFQSRFPGKLLHVETILESAYLPEEACAFKELGSPSTVKKVKRR